MTLIQWEDSLNVGIDEIDLDHQRLVEVINRLHEAVIEGQGQGVIRSTLDDLRTYVDTHFDREEHYFEQTGYPRAKMHKIEHSEFRRKVTAFESGFAEKRLTLSVDILNFLRDWLVEHIEGSDRDYVPHLRSSGVLEGSRLLSEASPD